MKRLARAGGWSSILLVFVCLTSVVQGAKRGKVDCHESLARVVRDPTADSVFRNSFHEAEVYEANYCRENVFRLLEAFRAEGVDLTNSRVLMLTGDFGVYPHNPRGLVTSWGMHAILLHQGRVYDLDYGTEPKVVTAKQYFKNALGGRGLAVLGIPAKAYLRNYPMRGNDVEQKRRAYFLKLADTTEFQSLDEFLAP